MSKPVQLNEVEDPEDATHHESGKSHKIKPVEDTTCWRFFHSAGFITGGTTFIAGTAVLYLEPTDFIANLSAFLYTVGSVGFLLVDVMEFFTFTENLLLRLNIAFSAIGSTLYVIGSAGFFPDIYNENDFYGIWGFIMGSLCIGLSQIWKVVRIG